MKLSDSKIPGTYLVKNKIGNNILTGILISFILITGICISILLSLKLQNLENKKFHKAFQSDINDRIFALQRRIDIHMQILQSLKSLFNASDFVSRDEFAIFSKIILDSNPDINTLAWIPKVKESEQDMFRKNAIKDGFFDFQINEISKDKKIIPAEKRNNYFPIYYIEPLKGNEKILGFDMGSNIYRKAAIETAAATNKATATPPITLIQDKKHKQAVIIVLPIFNEKETDSAIRNDTLIGFVEIITYPGIILSDAINAIDPSPIGIEMLLTDETNHMSETIFRHNARIGKTGIKDIEFSKLLEIGGRRWKITGYPTDKFIQNHQSYYPLLVFIIGSFISIIFSLYIFSLKKRSFEIEALVIKRTAELKDIHSQLLHSEKLSAIGRLSASIAHEFNNPLYGIKSVIEGIKRRSKLSKEDSELVDMAIKECDRMKKLIQELQDFNRPTSGSFSNVNLNKLLEQIILLTRKEMKEKKIKLQKRISKNLPLIKAIQDQVQQVILNLINNAIDACETGGIVKITTEVIGNEKIALHINDTGHGIPSDNIKHIFEPFFTTKPQVKGTGLGLPISYGIVKKHQGELKVVSEPGNTTFTLILPIKSQEKDNEAL